MLSRLLLRLLPLSDPCMQTAYKVLENGQHSAHINQNQPSARTLLS